MTARFPGKCAATGFDIKKGNKIVYIPRTKTVYKAMYVYPGQEMGLIGRLDHAVFAYVEAMFDQWYDDAPAWWREPYDGWGEDEPPVFLKRGAIEGAIEEMIYEADTTGQPVLIPLFDVEASFT
jgi:hypothetical protein